jgi:cytidyltransferase-like protein
MNANGSSKQVAVSGDFDNIRSHHLRFLEEAARLGSVTVLLAPDDAIQNRTGKAPTFSLAERLYFLQSVRYVDRVVLVQEDPGPEAVGHLDGFRPDIWVDEGVEANEKRRGSARKHGLEYHVFPPEELNGFPEPPVPPSAPGRKKVVVTGCYDWFHSGHVRFFEEASTYGDLYVIVGHDANIKLLKGAGHPLLPEAERRYMAGSIRFVTQALVSTGDGWLDADPEILRLKPDIYLVNEDGDKGGKREYCEKRGLQYLVLKRTPAPGLPKRSSTDLRGF